MIRAVQRFAPMLFVALVACFGALESPPAPPPLEPCSSTRLMAFDPGAVVLERHALPPMQQRLGEQTTMIAAIACESEEEDAECRRRTEAELRAAYPHATVRSYVTADRYELRAHMHIDGASREARFSDAAALESHLAELVGRGHEVKLEGVVAVATGDAQRHAVVEAVTAPREGARQLLRVRMRLEVPHDSVGTLFEVQARAARAGIALRLVTPADDGSIVIEYGCVAADVP
jgi:hypothetical protein